MEVEPAPVPVHPDGALDVHVGQDLEAVPRGRVDLLFVHEHLAVVAED